MCSAQCMSSVFSMVARVYQESGNERSETRAELFRRCQPCVTKQSGLSGTRCTSLILTTPLDFLMSWELGSRRNEPIRLSWRSDALHVPSIAAGCWPHFLFLGKAIPSPASRNATAGSGERGAGSGVQPALGRGARPLCAPAPPRCASRPMPRHPPPVRCGASPARAPYFLSNFSPLEDKAPQHPCAEGRGRGADLRPPAGREAHAA